MNIMLPITVESPNKGHFGANSFVPCREVVPISEGPLSEVPLYMSETEMLYIAVNEHYATSSSWYTGGCPGG